MNFIKILSNVTLFSLLLMPYVISASDEETAGGIMEEVVVTARKREETAQSVPIPITALGGDRLEAVSYTHLTLPTILLV